MVSEFSEVGAWVSQGDPVCEVIQLVPMEVEAFLPEKHIADIAVSIAEESVYAEQGQLLRHHHERMP